MSKPVKLWSVLCELIAVGVAAVLLKSNLPLVVIYEKKERERERKRERKRTGETTDSIRVGDKYSMGNV